jgi:tetratricopeptide (TPR) repeat protein
MRFLVLAGLSALLGAQEPAPPDINALLAEARVKLSKGDPAGAKDNLARAWAELEKSPREDQRRYDTLKLQSSIETMLGQYAEAEQYIQVAINWRETVNGRGDLKIADEYVEIAMLCYRQKDYERGLVLLQYAMNRLARGNTYDSAPVADVFSRMALMHLGQTKLDEAVFDLESAVQIRTKVYGADHASLLGDLDRLATTRIKLRHYDRAEADFRRILSIRERMVGPMDPDLIQTVEGLGYAFFGQKKYDEAQVTYQRLLKLWEASAGPDHPMVASTLEKIAVLYRDQRKWDESLPVAGRALAIRSLFYAAGLNQEAGARYLHGEKKEAEEMYRRALALLDPERSEHKELYAIIDGILKEIAPAAPKKGTKK